MWNKRYICGTNYRYMVSDDLRPEFPVYGQTQMKTPNVDRLVSRSITFSRAYCQQSICSPSRNSFMTGRRPDRTGVYNFVNDFRWVAHNTETAPVVNGCLVPFFSRSCLAALMLPQPYIHTYRYIHAVITLRYVMRSVLGEQPACVLDQAQVRHRFDLHADAVLI